MELPARGSDEQRLHRTAAVALTSAYLAAASVIIFGNLASGSSAPPYWLLAGVSVLVFVMALATHRLLRAHVYLAGKRQSDSGVARTPDRASILWAFTPEAWLSYPVYSGTLMIASYTGCVGLATALASAGAPSESWQTALGYLTVAGLSLGLHGPARWAFRRHNLGAEN